MYTKKAIALFSGGLDSILAVKIIQEQGIYVEGIFFDSVFFSKTIALKSANSINLKLNIIDISENILKIIKKPKYGFGKNLNPCTDCHLLMVTKAFKYMKEDGFDFVITGEVLGERPKSQNRKSLKIIEYNSGCEGLLLRPLSAKLLDITIPEQKKWVDRSKLLDIAGKTRRVQIKMASDYKLSDYPTPAGGCSLTVPQFADRLRERLENSEVTIKDIEILKYGRHFITDDNIKIIVSRNEKENEKLLEISENSDYIFKVFDDLGPITIVKSDIKDAEKLIAGSLTARYSKHRNNEIVNIIYEKKGFFKDKTMSVKPKDYKEFGNVKII